MPAAFREHFIVKIPFSKEAFLGVFRDYNIAIWPAQWVLLAMGVACAFLVFRTAPMAKRSVFLFLSLLWLWMGVVYHLSFFSHINTAAFVFGVLFIVEAIALFIAGVIHEPEVTSPARGWQRATGMILIIYALLVYPLLGFLIGHSYPEGPTFGVPCPTTIFTFGVLLLLRVRIPGWAAVIPLLWSLVGLSAAIQLAMPEDYGLVVAGILYALVKLGKRNPRTQQAAS